MRKLVPTVAAIAVAAGVVALPSQGATTPKPRQVAVKDDFYKPTSITIKKGVKVVWTWRGKHRHNVNEANGKWGSTTKRKGTFSHTFKKKGKYLVLCTIHAPDMEMTIHVK
jgi:plastocyanin